MSKNEAATASRFHFRVWDKNGEWMSYGERENYDDMIAWRFAHWDPATDDPSDPELSGVVLMQSTGLTDKSGKLQWQGDIALAKGKLYEIRWMEDTGCNEYVGIDNAERHVIYQMPHPVEVIGNIYENPELLPSA